MENMEQRWLDVENMLTERFGKKPDMEGILFLIGVNELDPSRLPVIKFTKEQKQDLMHVAICTLLAPGGYYEMESVDEDGWPHFKQLKPMPDMNTFEQENFLKDHILLYFEENDFAG